jgi:hypothetical protein
MPEICKTLSVPYKPVGSLVVAFSDEEIETLDKLLERGKTNGVPGLEIYDKEKLNEAEPYISDEAKAALWAPSAGIVCPYELTIAAAENATHQDLVKFGLIPELVGRLPVVTGLKGMDKETLIRIMTEPKNSIVKQYQALFGIDGVELVFDKDALERIAELTIERKTGARGLRSIIEATLQPIMFNTPSESNIKTITVTKATVDGKDAVIEYKE